MSNNYTGVKVLEVSWEKIELLYKEKSIPLWDQRYNWYQNLYVVLKDETGTSKSALARVKGDRLILINGSDYSISGLKARNKEQRMALDMLMDDSIKVCMMTGRAGSGKTILALASAMQQFENNHYKKIILTRPMSWVGKHGLGALPGDSSEKFYPYLQNYMNNIEFLLKGKKNVDDLIRQYKMEFIPIQLIRGASWHDAFILADECQTFDYHEMVSLGTRVAEGSKIVIMGDLSQRDEKITREKTGIYKFVNHELVKNSNFVASIELLKSERSCVADLFANVFEAY
jgi:PhoH-like ATPase